MKKLDKTKLIPPFTALLASLISCVVSIVQQVDFALFVKRLAIAAAVFLLIGYIVRIALWYVFKPEPEESEEEDKEGSDEDVTIEEPGNEDNNSSTEDN